MFSTLRNRFGIPGVISVIALVFAMIGGAYAANNLGGSGKSATASAKKKAAKGPRGPRGATGPAGPAGAAGPAGPKGDTGAAGANGSNGADGAKGATGKDGQGVTTSVEPPFAECGEQEGVEIKSASGTNYVCNGVEGAQGAKGDPWAAGGTLPNGAVLTGGWALHETTSPNFGSFLAYTTISFPIRLDSDLPSGDVFVVDKSVPAECDDTTHPGKPEYANPEATAGHLCIYPLEPEPLPSVTNFGFEDGADAEGAVLYVPHVPAVVDKEGNVVLGRSNRGTFAVGG